MRTTSHLTPKIFGCVSFVNVHGSNRGKLDLRAIKYIFVGYSSTQKRYKCYHPPTKKFVSADVTFNESESYFPATYLQRENSIKEDKDQDFYFIYLFLVDPPTVSNSVYVSSLEPKSSCIEPISKHELSPIEPISKLELSPIEFAPKNRMTDKVYSRKKATVP